MRITYSLLRIPIKSSGKAAPNCVHVIKTPRHVDGVIDDDSKEVKRNCEKLLQTYNLRTHIDVNTTQNCVELFCHQPPTSAIARRRRPQPPTDLRSAEPASVITPATETVARSRRTTPHGPRPAPPTAKPPRDRPQPPPTRGRGHDTKNIKITTPAPSQAAQVPPAGPAGPKGVIKGPNKIAGNPNGSRHARVHV